MTCVILLPASHCLLLITYCIKNAGPGSQAIAGITDVAGNLRYYMPRIN